jgi:uncharacterized membrane protein
MITIQWLYVMAGLMFAAFALLSALDRSNKKRFGNAAFWGLMALSLLAGDFLGDFGNGLLVLGLAALAGFGQIGRSSPPTTSDEERRHFSERLGNRLFLPALIIPATALFGTLLYNYTPLGTLNLFEPKRETYILLGLGVLLALAVIFAWLRPPAVAPLQEGRRLIDAIGWAAVLPQMLAALGVLFAAAGVGTVIGDMTRSVIPEGSVFATVAVFGLGMALFTMIQGYDGNPAVIGAIGMLAGFCGTLMTPMAANFNIVPAALLELKDRNGVIKAQIGTALPLLAANILLIYFLAFR